MYIYLISQNTLIVSFESSSKPKIFYIYNKKLIKLLNISHTQKLLLFLSSGEPLISLIPDLDPLYYPTLVITASLTYLLDCCLKSFLGFLVYLYWVRSSSRLLSRYEACNLRSYPLYPIGNDVLNFVVDWYYRNR